MTDDFEGWYCLRVRSQREREVAENLTDRHLSFYLPMERRLKNHSGRKIPRSYPFLPGYLFVDIRLKGDFYHVKCTPGVDSFLTDASGAPRRVPDGQMERLFAYEAAGSFNDVFARDPKICRFDTGQTVTILDGPFHGLSGPVEKGGEARTFTVLTWLFGRETPVHVEACQLRAA